VQAQTLDALVEELLTSGEDAFRARHSTPVLVRTVPIHQGDDDDSGFHTEVQDRKAMRATAKLNRRTIQMRTVLPPPPEPEADSDRSGDVTIVHPIEKRPGAPFRDRIGIGRSADVLISLPAMSKYHAFFTAPTTEGTPYTLTDAESKNGTFVGPKKLVPRVAEPVEDGTALRFGPYHMTFRTPEGLLDLVRSRAKPK
jgi:hypothetical protein